MIAILDYKAGNQTSVLRALNFLNIEACITDKSDILMQADGIIFPGVGAAKQAMDRLTNQKQDKVLKELIAQKIPLLGICLGCQILLDYSEENNTKTLGILPGVCKKFNPDWTDGVNEKNNPEKYVYPIWAGIPLPSNRKVPFCKICIAVTVCTMFIVFILNRKTPILFLPLPPTEKNLLQFLAMTVYGLYNSTLKKAEKQACSF